MRASTDDSGKGRTQILPQAGSLLVAQPLLQDPAFSRSVAMMMDVDFSLKNIGCMALVLNKKIETLKLGDIFPDWQFPRENPNVFLGGPVETNHMFVIHRLGNLFPDSLQITPGYFIGGNLQNIQSYIEQGGRIDGLLRFFVGYSGWGSQQLLDELAQNAWAVTPPPGAQNLIIGNGEEFWRDIVISMGEAYKNWLSIPLHPELN